MSIEMLVLLAIQASVFLTVLAVGIRVEPADLPSLLRTPSRLIRSLLVLNVLTPVLAILVCKTFPLHPAVIAGLLTLAIAPVSNIFTVFMRPLVTPGKRAYARGLLFASTILSVGLTPLAVEVIQAIFGLNVHVNPLAVARVVVADMLLPLGLGLAIGRRWPAARRHVPAIHKASMLVLGVCAAIIIVGAWSPMASVVRLGTFAAIVLFTTLGLAVGHVLGGPDEDNRTVLANATVSRHQGVAMAVASLSAQPLAPAGVLLAVLVSSVAVIPYNQWRKRRRGERAPWGGAERRYHREGSFTGPERRVVRV